MNQSRNFTSLLNPSYLQNAQQNAATANAAAAAAAAAAAVSAAIANGTAINSSPNRKREAESKLKHLQYYYNINGCNFYKCSISDIY